MLPFDLNQPPDDVEREREGGEDTGGGGGDGRDVPARTAPRSRLGLTGRGQAVPAPRMTNTQGEEGLHLGGRRLPPLGLVGRPRGGYARSNEDKLAMGRGRPRPAPLGLRARSARPIIIGTAGSEPMAPAAHRPAGGGSLGCPHRAVLGEAEGSGNRQGSSHVNALGHAQQSSSIHANAGGHAQQSGSIHANAGFGFDDAHQSGSNANADGHAHQSGFSFDDTHDGFGFDDAHNASQEFENHDEFAPSQEHVNTNVNMIDLNVMATRKRRRQYDTDAMRYIYGLILGRNGPGHLKHGVTAGIVAIANVSQRTVERIWERGRQGGGVNAMKNRRKINCGRKRVELDEVAMKAVPHGDRTTLVNLASALNMTRTTVHQRLKEKEFRRHSSDLKPALTPENIKARVEYCLRNLEPASLPENPTFKAGFNVVHIDEKWFYRTKKNQKIYLTNKEPNPERQVKNKGHIQKIMFIAAMARPRYYSHGNCTMDGKIGVWPYVEWVAAKKKSKIDRGERWS